MVAGGSQNLSRAECMCIHVCMVCVVCACLYVLCASVCWSSLRSPLLQRGLLLPVQPQFHCSLTVSPAGRLQAKLGRW